MALNTEQANLILTINGTQAGTTLKDLRNKSKDLQRALDETSDPKEFARLTNELRAVNTQLADARAATRGVSSAMAQARTEGGLFSKVMSGAASVFLGGGILGIVQSIGSGILNLGKTAIQASADMESLKATVEVFLGSGKAATQFLKDIQKFAAQTPFEFPELAKAGKSLLAFGYSGDEAMKLLKRLGDVSAAAQVPIGELSAIIGKAKLGQKIQGEELNQLADRGINIFPELAKVLGTTEDQIKKLGSDGKIAYADLEKAITLATDKGGQFYGLMDKQSKTFSGLMSTLKDNFGQFVQSIFTGSTEALKPAIAAVSDFFGQLTDLIREGKQPVGEYAEVIQFAATILRGLGSVFGIVWEAGKILLGFFLEQIKVTAYLGNRLGELVNWFVNLAAEAKKIPLIAFFFKPVLDAVGLLSDLLGNASATFAGFRAAAQQAVTNVQNYFRALVYDAEILGEKIAGALVFDKALKAGAQARIAELEKQKGALFQAGKSVEQAYSDGRNAAIAIQTKVEADGEAKKKAAAKKGGPDPKEAEKAAKDHLKKLKEYYDIQLKEAELYWDKEALLNENAFLNKTRNESDYVEQESIIAVNKYDLLLKIQREYLTKLKAGTIDYLETEKKILELEKKKLEADAKIAPRRATVTEALPTFKPVRVEEDPTKAVLRGIQTAAEAEKNGLQQRFAQILFGEQELAIARLEIQSRAYDAQLEALTKAGQKETDEYKRISEAKKDTDKDVFENKKKLKEYEEALEQAKIGIAQSAIQAGIELLSIDEAARKKHAAAIKAFEIGAVWVSFFAETQGIWKNAHTTLPPGIATGVAVAQTAIAAVRAGIATAKIAKQQFGLGGIAKLGVFGGRPHSSGGTKGVFEDGTAVEVERDEAFVVLNRKSTGLLQRLSALNVAGGGVPFFANGGVLSLNTTPSVPTSMGGATVVNVDMVPVVTQLEVLTRTVANQQTQMRAILVRSELEAAVEQDAKDKAAASW